LNLSATNLYNNKQHQPFKASTSTLSSLVTVDLFHYTRLYPRYPYNFSRFHPLVSYYIINQVAYSINLLFLGNKKVQRAKHPYLPRPKNSIPLSQAQNLLNNNHPTISIYPPPQMDLDPNLTESQGNVTQPQWDIGPFKTHDGYEGSNQHFGVRVNVIKIKNTDAVLGHMPSEEQQQLSVNKKGKFSKYEQQKMGDETYQLWMSKIGPYLADWVLHLPRHGAFSTFSFPAGLR
jgi:hypothetical protein